MTRILPTDLSKLYELLMNFTSSYLGDLSQNYVPILFLSYCENFC